MRITVLGGTGGSGRLVIEGALARGWEVTALARSPEKLNEFNHDRLQVVKADIFKGDVLAKHMAGSEAVVSCLGISGVFFPWTDVTICSESIKVIIDAMRAAEVSRLICMSTWCTVSHPDNPKTLEWLVKPMFLRGVVVDFCKMEDYITQQQDIDYTVVKCPQLTNTQTTGEPIQTSDLEYVPDGSMFIRRADVARFILDTLQANIWKKKKVSIATT